MNDSLQTPLRLERVASLRRVPEAAWDALVAGRSPFLCWAWQQCLEDAGLFAAETGWVPAHVLLWDGPRLVGAVPAWRKAHSYGEFVYDFSWAHLADRLGEPYYPKLVSTAPYTPAGGPRLLVAPDLTPVEADAVRGLLIDTLTQAVDGRRLHSAHVLFAPLDEATALQNRGWMLRLAHQYHWRNEGYADFDAFLERFRAKRRKEIRRERRLVAEAGYTVRIYDGHTLTPAGMDQMFAFYDSTCERYMGGNRYLNRAFFELVQQRLPDAIRVFLAEDRDGEVVAGTFNVQWGDRLYGRYWGSSREVPFLHFEVCYYRMIEYAIAEGLQVIEPGAGGDHKYARGFDPVETWSAHHLFSPRMHTIIERHLERERAFVRYEIDQLTERSPVRPRDRIELDDGTTVEG